ncbi:clotting factor G beta subunit-like [Ornithodoros turicata]|uniref:clotting factor G beta subunit-like n=1 Tax=Ornithodoros turicata TaxID=34597 RepID=UPI003138B1FB
MFLSFAGILATCVYILCSGVDAGPSGIIFEDEDKPICPPHLPACVEVSQCPSAIRAIRRGQHPTTCDWIGTTPLVCCSNDVPAAGSGSTAVPSTEGAINREAVPSSPPPITTTEETEETQQEGAPVAEETPGVNRAASPDASRETTQPRNPDVTDSISVCGVRPGEGFSKGPPRNERTVLGRIESRRGLLQRKSAREPYASRLNRQRVSNDIHDNWPWVVFLEDSRETARRCAGVLLDKRHVLTAAQCLGTDFRDNTVVRVNLPGESSVRRLLGGAMHPVYKYPDGYGDVAVLEFTPPLRPNQLPPICLPKVISERRSFHGRLLTVVDGDEPGSMTERKYRVIQMDRCNATYTGVALSPFPNGIDDEDFLCAQPDRNASNQCNGVPGSPIMVRERGAWTVVGIYSFGVGCGGSSNYPTVFTKITPFVTWIHEYLGL